MKNKVLIRMVLNSEDENIFEDVKNKLSTLSNHIENLSFSPMRPYFRYNNYGECSITFNLDLTYLEELKTKLSTYWQGEYEDDIETDQIMGKVFHANVFYMNLQVL